MLRDEFQAWLDRNVEMIEADDFGGFRDLFLLPAAFVTDTAITVVEDDGLLRDAFDAWRNMMDAQGVTHMVRQAEAAIPLDDDLISGDYTTRLLRDATPVVPPYSSTAMLRRIDRAWKAERITTSLANVAFPIIVPRVSE